MQGVNKSLRVEPLLTFKHLFQQYIIISIAYKNTHQTSLTSDSGITPQRSSLNTSQTFQVHQKHFSNTFGTSGMSNTSETSGISIHAIHQEHQKHMKVPQEHQIHL